MDKKLLLIILDGFGIGPPNEHNAIWRAKTPFFDSLMKRFPHAELEAAGEAVGILPGQIGSSEVGHLNIGAGRTVHQDILRIHNAIRDGSFFKNSALLRAAAHARTHHSALHLIGLISPAGVHSHTDHLYALLTFAARERIDRVFVHAFLDGRDTPPSSAHRYLEELEDEIHARHRSAKIATLGGRFFGMDRDRNWHRTKQMFGVMTQGTGQVFGHHRHAIDHFYSRRLSDEFIEPCIIEHPDGRHLVRSNDAIIFFNFRADRMRQLVNLFLNRVPEAATHNLHNLSLVSMAEYFDTSPEELVVAYEEAPVTAHVSEVLSAYNFPQFKIAETEKYAHLTYFFNGGKEAPYPKEERLMIPSPKVENFSATPEMSSPKIVQDLVKQLGRRAFPFLAANFCNADMLGHTGNLQAAILGVECLDQCLKQVVTAATQAGYTTLITADHGNAEQMYNPESGQPHTAHTVNPVPLIAITDRPLKIANSGTLAQVAPTILELLGIEKPTEMTAPSLMVKKGES